MNPHISAALDGNGGVHIMLHGLLVGVLHVQSKDTHTGAFLYMEIDVIFQRVLMHLGCQACFI